MYHEQEENVVWSSLVALSFYWFVGEDKGYVLGYMLWLGQEENYEDVAVGLNRTFQLADCSSEFLR